MVRRRYTEFIELYKLLQLENHDLHFFRQQIKAVALSLIEIFSRWLNRELLWQRR